MKETGADTHLAESLLETAGIRSMSARRHILASLISLGRPVTHSQLRKVEPIGTLDRVTVYRTLKTLLQGGLVHAVRGTDGITRYCAHAPTAAGCPSNHPHFVCRNCGKMVCLPDQRMPRVEVPPGCKVEGKQFLVFGLCEVCSEDR